MATPAAAQPTFGVEINSGVLVLHEAIFNNTDTIDLAPSGSSPCAAPSITFEFTGPGYTTITILGFASEGHIQLSGTGPMYQVRISATNTPINGSATPRGEQPAPHHRRRRAGP